ncbi:MAG TPA: hypothetical protein VGI55_06600 [Solirubrobacteraceae bacterium]|jgi:hypothetical protein
MPVRPAGLTIECGAAAVADLTGVGVATGSTVATVAKLALAADAR